MSQDREWSPALKSAVQQLQRKINELVQSQAQHLDLPPDGEVDMQRQVWILPDESPDFEPVEGEG